MKIIGVTGGVGSGKSTVLAYLIQQYDVYLLKTDELSHNLMRRGTPCFRQVVELLGNDVIEEVSGELNRPKIAEKIFQDESLRLGMNRIMHPAVKEAVINDIELQKQKGMKFYFLESALLLEEKYDEICDELWYVYASESVRRARLKQSRGYSDDKVSQIMQKQQSEEIFRRACDFEIKNDSDAELMHRQIDARMKLYHEIM